MSRELMAFTRNVGREAGSRADLLFNTVCERTTAFSGPQEILLSDLPSPLLSNSPEEALLRDIRYEHFQSTCRFTGSKKTLTETTYFNCCSVPLGDKILYFAFRAIFGSSSAPIGCGPSQGGTTPTSLLYFFWPREALFFHLF